MRFSYYKKLSRSDQRIYRASDAVATVKLPVGLPLRSAIADLEVALAAERRLEVQRAARALCLGIAEVLNLPPVSVKVLAVRPRQHDGSELHGLYTAEEGERPVIEVWMRTAAHRRVVAFRTFLRTLIHEVCHHLDYHLLGLADSFHTEGFFQRESSIVRQLLAQPSRSKDAAAGERPARSRRPAKQHPPKQLRLPL